MSGGTLSFRETPKYNAVTDEKRPKNNKVCYVLYNFNKDWKPSIWESEMLYGQDHDRLGGGGRFTEGILWVERTITHWNAAS